ncbi:MAG: hypothetical protein JEY97_00795 [Bacteroidales bacterium]|nr:hypothetical protein [Bacteroidales bacterium]
MSKIKRILKKFKGTDAEMLEEARIKANALKIDIDLFAAFDPKFTIEYVNAFDAKIVKAEAEIVDNVIKDQLAAKTATVENILDSCRKKYRSVKYFVGIAFENNKAVQNEFGFNDYNTSRRSQVKMLVFMRQLGISAKRYQSELIAAGMTEESINEIETLSNDLSLSNEQQEDFKKQRVLLTQSRIILYNEVWDYVRQVARAGKIIFEDNPAKYAIYLLSDEN